MPKRYSLYHSSFAIFIALNLMIGPAIAKSKPPKAPTLSDSVPLDAVVQAIQDGLTESEKYEVPAFPPFQSATVSVATTVEKDVNGKVKIFVFNVGGEYTVDNASTLTFELTPPKVEKTAKVQAFNPQDIKNAIANQIANAKLGVVAANSRVKALQTDTVTIQIDFKVTKQGTGGVDTGTILPVGIQVNGKYSQQTGNTVKLVFSAKAP